MTDVEIFEREIRHAVPTAHSVAVRSFPDDEAYEATVDGVVYRFEAGSDDDEFVFLSTGRAPITFAIPSDFLD